MIAPIALATIFLRIDGTVTEGGAAGSFEQIIDMRSGAQYTTRVNGPMRETSGFDGVFPWVFGNGIAVRRDLPASVSEARAEAFVARLGWTSVPATERFDLPDTDDIRVSRTGRDTVVTIDADDGPETIVLRDWRRAGDIEYPFSRTISDAVGEVTVFNAEKITKLANAPENAFAMPSPSPHGSIHGSATVPIEFAGRRDPHIVVRATIDGHDAPLIFDTGGANYFSPKAAQQWGIDIGGGLAVAGPGQGSDTGGYGRIRSIAIGGARLDDEIAVIAPLPWPEDATSPPGLTGREFLAEFRTTIDYPAHTLTFAPLSAAEPADGTALPFYNDGSAIYVDASVNGVRGLFRVDTGDGRAVTLFKTFADAHGIMATGNTDTRGRGVGGAVPVKNARLKEFSFGPSTMHDVAASISQTTAGSFSSRTIAGNLGGSLFRCYRMTFDYRAESIVVTSVPSTDSCLASLSATQ